ncbi:uncharacterized protein mlnl [Esox lucius]|uniref:uncharacterized protein mlnl n=1 Tax=Esox lucius TaxID=8010 RepID=UPI00147772A7|nr:uncharacterized protein mlnl [Esox lucius]
MTMRGAVMCCVLLVCLVAMFAKQVEGHFSFFSPKEMREMKALQNKLGRKDMEPQTENGQLQDVTIKQLREVDGRIPEKIMEIGVRLTAKQLELVGPVLEEIINEMVEQAE